MDYLIVDLYSDHKDIDRSHSFPTTRENLKELVSELGGDGTNYLIVDSRYGEMGLFFPPYILADLNELNYLGVKLSELDEYKLDLLAAVLHCQKQSGVQAVINIIENLNCFNIQPADNPTDYGEILADIDAIEFAETIKQLEDSDSPTQNRLASYIGRLKKHLDYKAYGESVAAEENGHFTIHGYVTQTSGLSEIYNGIEDIPEEYLVSEPVKSTMVIDAENCENNDIGNPHIKLDHTADNAKKPSVLQQLLQAKEQISSTPKAAHDKNKGIKSPEL